MLRILIWFDQVRLAQGHQPESQSPENQKLLWVPRGLFPCPSELDRGLSKELLEHPHNMAAFPNPVDSRAEIKKQTPVSSQSSSQKSPTVSFPHSILWKPVCRLRKGMTFYLKEKGTSKSVDLF